MKMKKFAKIVSYVNNGLLERILNLSFFLFISVMIYLFI